MFYENGVYWLAVDIDRQHKFAVLDTGMLVYEVHLCKVLTSSMISFIK